MKKRYILSSSAVQTVMIVTNFITIVFCGSVVLLSTKYIINHQMSRTFLSDISTVPTHPLVVFFVPIILYAILISVINRRNHGRVASPKRNLLYAIVEIAICFPIVYLLYMGYNGVILLVFADIISYMKDNKNSILFLGALILLFLISNYDVISIQIPMLSLQDYIGVYDATTKVALSATKNILETLNIVLFIVFMISYIANQKQENENITKELSMIHQVNEELRNYATMTEKIGEDRERKRIAREIHDTLGHALTGIAAGVDACIAMIDKHPKETKEQLHVVSKVVRQGIGDVRGSLQKLRPGALEGHTFKEAISQMINEFSKISDIVVTLDYQLENIDFDKTKEDTLFRIIQESITNAKRHGKATLVTIRMYEEDGVLQLSIMDNGIGCTDIKTGFGLKHMEERVRMMNGSFTINGEDGFCINIAIPMKKGEQYD